MTDIFEAEIRYTTVMFVRVFTVTSGFSLVAKSLMVLRSGLESLGNPLFHFMFPTFLMFYSCFLSTTKDRSLRTKQISLYIGIEIVLILCKTVSYSLKDQKTLLMFATAGVINFQARLVTSYSAVIFIGSKHLVEWYLYDAIQENLAVHPFDLISIVGFLGMMLILTNNRNKYIAKIKDYNHILNENNKNLQVLIETLQSGLVILNDDLSLMNLNIKAKTLLEGNELNLMNILQNVQYRGEETCSVYDSILDNSDMNLNSDVSLGSVYRNSMHISLNLSKIKWSESFIYVLLLIDVTDTVKLENSILENELKTKFLNFIPHELQTPTVGILGCAEGSIEAVKDDDKQLLASNLEIIYNSARRLHTMICNIADYTEIISNRFELRISKIDLKAIIEEACEVLFKEAKAQKLAIILRVDPNIPDKIQTDKQRLFQLLTILLSNSMKYTYRGFIEIVAVLEGNGQIRVEINDTGIGITAEMLDLIYTQLRSPQPGHLFFGLEVSNNIARRIGNSPLKISSNGGTSVIFNINCKKTKRVLPVSEDSTGSVEVYEGEHLFEIREFSISRSVSQVLIVDDIESSRAVLARILERENLKFIEARDGQQAIELVLDCDRRKKPLELIIMDIDMPVMNGWEATIAIFNMFQRGDIMHKPFVVAYSAYTAPECIERATLLGMISYIKKPARARDITRIIKNLVNTTE